MMSHQKIPPPPMNTLKFIMIAMVMMLLVDHFVFKGTRDYIEDARKQVAINQAQTSAPKAVKITQNLTPPTKVIPPDGAEYFESVPAPMMEEPEVVKAPDTLAPPIEISPPLIRHNGKAKIAIIIDDVGMDIRHSKAAVNLPAPITLALLPYAPRVQEFANLGRENGHTLIIHVPMEAMDKAVSIGPMGLKENMDGETLKAEMGKMLSSFDGYEGINNHMGSRLTQDSNAMKNVMNILKSHNLFFVDSKTAGNSVAADMAAKAGLSFAVRDIFLDHEDSAAFVQKALKKTERLALSRGYAIAIGHPKQHTLAGLNQWIPTLEAKGIELVSVKDLLSSPSPQRGETPTINMFPETQKVPHPNPLPEGEGIGVETLPEGEEVHSGDNFYDEVNKVFAPETSEPEIKLHPLPQQ